MAAKLPKPPRRKKTKSQIDNLIHIKKVRGIKLPKTPKGPLVDRGGS